MLSVKFCGIANIQLGQNAIPSAIVVFLGVLVSYLLFFETELPAKVNQSTEKFTELHTTPTKTDQLTELPIATGRLTGVWCICWQHNGDNPTEYEVGSMNLQHFESGELKGQFYCGDNMWNLEGKFEDLRLQCDYKHYEKAELEGSFKLEPSDGNNNFDKLKGIWSGTSLLENKREEVHGLKFYAARGGKYYNEYCHLKEFDGKQEHNEGRCTISYI